MRSNSCLAAVLHGDHRAKKTVPRSVSGVGQRTGSGIGDEDRSSRGSSVEGMESDISTKEKGKQVSVI